MKNKPKFLIFDGNAIVHRSFHALPLTMTTKTGEPINAVYGFTAFLFRALKEFKPTYAAVSFDLKGPTFRHKEYAEYKATRVKAPQELYDQMDRVKEVVRALNIPIYEEQGFEADDVIGTVITLVHDKIDTIIVTGDMDAIQLVGESTFVYAMSRGISESVLYDTTAVKNKYSFEPLQMIDYKALRGDPSDNIPGVKGVGEKTATELIIKFGSLEALYEAIDEDSEKLATIKPRILELLKEHKDIAILSKRLATIRRDVPLDFDLEVCKLGGVDVAATSELFISLEFKSLLPRLREIFGETVTTEVVEDLVKVEIEYKVVDTEDDFKKIIKELKKQKLVAISTKTISAEDLTISGVALSWKAGQSSYINLAGNGGGLFGDGWLATLKPILADENLKKIGHDIKQDFKAWRASGLELNGIIGDTRLADYLLNPDNRQHDLAVVVLRELQKEMIASAKQIGQAKLDFEVSTIDSVAKIANEEADMIGCLNAKLHQHLKEFNQLKLYEEMELPLIRVLAKMEERGLLLDIEYLKKLDEEADKALAILTDKIYKEAGEEFNINSVQQLRTILFEKLKISTVGVGKTKTGHSTGADELEKLKEAHPIVPLITEYRELSKLSSTYIKALPKLVNQKDGRLHTTFNQAVAATGRLSSTNPNLQNIPMKTDLGRKVRQAFIVPKGKTLLSLDYSQIELRLAAHMSNDPTMIKTFKAGGDIHRTTAAKINNVALEDVTNEMRRAAKAINFGLLYGQGPRGLAQGVGISYNEAKHFIDQYFINFAKVKGLMDKIILEARAKGYVETLLGRRRYVPEINSTIVMLAKAAERAAINAPLQGTAADMIKLAMLKVDKMINEQYGDKVKMILQIHDELVFEVDQKLVVEVMNLVKPLMENVLKLKVPILVEAKIGTNWEEMKKA
ncbi:DNA polymerase I [Candidatus Falkowbacteria bacterium CG10_big_fil_rev_8_21_14_0_10_37_14]|uniref:DNA polymerase I n=1 Tax=Candidatus Falkowbacteria bacterium CG10_big_fil_rev_8_21_14_0_10_37_14 TaxID=1974561 RepID=A0A2M6WTE9_9BACT|nr:DNA polymerase I [Candidatus Falkowbacteria bacterium]PIT96055.1 MAG: DNA polymerase I [Candidatus Falkowbacteria bacterium CG10_big_fil_rev_8_21_14_0_10_37_14]